MNLSLVTTTYLPPEDQTWLGSIDGADTADSITLDGALLIAIFTGGIVPSGVCLAKNTVSGKYTRYLSGGANGVGTPQGFLLTTKDLTSAGRNLTGADVGAALMWQGEIIEAKLPTGHGLDSAAKTALAGRFYFV